MRSTARGIGFDGDLRLDGDRDRNALLARRRRDVLHRPADRLVGAEPAVGQPLAPGLEAGHVQNVADHVQQVLAARQDVLAVVAVFLRSERTEGLTAHQLREADDRVERRAQLVAHVGEKIGLGAIGRFGLRLLLVVALGEIDQLLGLLLERPARLAQLRDGGEQQALGIHQLLFMLLERGDVGSDRHESAVARAPLVDLQPSAVRQPRLVGARLAPCRERLAGRLAPQDRRRRARGADGGFGKIVEALVLGVAQHQPMAGIPQHEGLRDRFDRVAQTLVGRRRRFRLALALGDVEGDADSVGSRVSSSSTSSARLRSQTQRPSAARMRNSTST